MYQLALSINLIFQKTESDVADRRLRLVYAIVAVMALVWPVLIFTAPLYISDKTELNIAVRLYYDIAYVILLLAFSSILLYLLLTLRKLPEFFKKEQRHIFRQFLVYWSSFLIKIVGFGLTFLSTTVF